ncbi:GNAT family N-acetyltransferase [Sporolactobacillus pectinivorans]|uniref:GNAT family N-acetyltransferase n=1 Tax=Sporolactobacillus pectinivorans TaxID=1591408 RepID=UPI0030B809A0
MIHCRLATCSDAALIHSLMIRAFAEYQKSGAPSSAMKETAASIQKSLAASEQALIAYDDGSTPVGMVRFMLRRDDVYFYRLAVIPERQGHGIAKTIVYQMEEVARRNGKNMAVCRVRKNVGRNLKLYQSIGFHIFDQEIVHKPGGINLKVVHMKKKL